MTLAERRAAIRRVPDAGDLLSRVRLRTGDHLRVLDVSDQGALVEGLVRLLPGTGVDMQVATATGRVMTRARVVRSEVSHLRADRVAYRAAVAFERQVDTGSGYPVPHASLSEGEIKGTVYPDRVAERPRSSSGQASRRAWTPDF